MKSSKWTVLVLCSHAVINDDKVIIRGYDKIAIIGGDDRWLEPGDASLRWLIGKTARAILGEMIG